jgi:hypothetical protein
VQQLRWALNSISLLDQVYSLPTDVVVVLWSSQLKREVVNTQALDGAQLACFLPQELYPCL